MFDGIKKYIQRKLVWRSFEAASIGRITADFLEMSNEIDQDIRARGKRLRNRARQAYVNNAFATRLVELYINDIAGENGHTFQSDITRKSEDKNTRETFVEADYEKNTLIENLWTEFSKAKNFSVTGKDSFGTISRKAAASRFIDGEAFIRRVWDRSAKFGFYTQIIPAETIAEDYNAVLPNGNIVKMGIELNEFGRPVRYHAYKRTPDAQLHGNIGNAMMQLVPIPAEDMIHWYDPKFANQTRGFSRFAPILLQLTWYRDFSNYSVINAKISAAKLGLLSDIDPTNPMLEIPKTGKDAKKNITISAKPGSFQDIGSKKLWQWDPKFPHEQQEPFARVMLREIASGAFESYSSLSGDYSQHNFSSQRGEAESIHRAKKAEQQSMIETIDLRIFEWMLEGAMMKGLLKISSYQTPEEYNKPYFAGPSWDYINPVDESNAVRSDLEACLVSPFEVAAKKGRKYEDILRDRAEAIRLEKKYGVVPVYGKTGNLSMESQIIQSTNGKPKTNGVAAQ